MVDLVCLQTGHSEPSRPPEASERAFSDAYTTGKLRRCGHVGQRGRPNRTPLPRMEGKEMTILDKKAASDHKKTANGTSRTKRGLGTYLALGLVVVAIGVAAVAWASQLGIVGINQPTPPQVAESEAAESAGFSETEYRLNQTRLAARFGGSMPGDIGLGGPTTSRNPDPPQPQQAMPGDIGLGGPTTSRNLDPHQPKQAMPGDIGLGGPSSNVESPASAE